MLTATIRGWHLLAHGDRAVLHDYLGWPLVGAEAEAIQASLVAIFGGSADPFATWITARTRLAEDWLASSGAAQYVILGAGLDSFAWRKPTDVRVFEVDHPSTQAWKRARLTALTLDVPEALVWVPVDFESQSLMEQLERAGLTGDATFVSWLGVVPYLTLDGIHATLCALPSCSLVVSYLTPPETWEGESRRIGQRLEAVVRERGEPWLSYFAPSQLGELLRGDGFAVVEDVGPDDIEGRYGLHAINYERVTLASKP
jgi:methyltransferase (TIGR00027 family)